MMLRSPHKESQTQGGLRIFRNLMYMHAELQLLSLPILCRNRIDHKEMGIRDTNPGVSFS